MALCVCVCVCVMAAMAEAEDAEPLRVGMFRVEGPTPLSVPLIHMRNRRAAGSPTTQWVCQRHLEIVLFGRSDGGSSGPIWKALHGAGLGSTSLCVSKKTVQDGLLTEGEYKQILVAFKQALPADQCDPSSLGRIRTCTLIPSATAAAVCRQHGRSPASMAWLRAFSEVVPLAWSLREEQEANEAANEVLLSPA